MKHIVIRKDHLRNLLEIAFTQGKDAGLIETAHVLGFMLNTTPPTLDDVIKSVEPLVELYDNNVVINNG